MVIISGPKVDWEKMGTWRVIDDQPDPPTNANYGAIKGWKMVEGLVVSKGGGSFMLPTDQILLVHTHHNHTPLSTCAQFRSCFSTITYILVTYIYTILPQVLDKGYKPLKTLECRLDKLQRGRKYLVWYHHLHTNKAIQAKRDALESKM